MKAILYKLVALLCAAAPCVPIAGQELDCTKKADEPVLMKQAPSGVRRIGTHTLEVRYIRGSRRFVDKPPHEDLGGLHWRYCGYDAKARSHLILRQAEGLFSGQLMGEESGRILPAGHTVLFSGDRKKFLAIEQRDGEDGEQWSVVTISGKLLWRGYAGILAKEKGIARVASQFVRPRWSAEGSLSAMLDCGKPCENQRLVVLVDSESGWQWREIAN